MLSVSKQDGFERSRHKPYVYVNVKIRVGKASGNSRASQGFAKAMKTPILIAVAALLVPAVSACAQSGLESGPLWVEPASEQARTLTPTRPADDARPSDAIEARLLAAHNAERARVGAPALIWSDSLEAEARDWARTLIETGRFAHDPRPHGHGENLWTGWGGRSFTPEDMVGDWIEERSSYRPGVFPNVSRTGDWVAVGHYTQLIWADTTHVGCAVETRGDQAMLACRYSPPGNIDGRRP